jgi:golgi phosphoprotein 3
MLTLPEELLLLSLDDHGHPHDVPAANLEAGLLAAAIYELQLRGRVEIELENVRVLDASPTGDPVLDGTLEMLGKPDSPRGLEALLTKNHHHLSWIREGCMGDLVTRGIVRKDQGRVLWLLPQQRYAVEHGGEETSLIERLLRALILGQPADRRTSALLTLLASCYTSDHHLRERLFGEMRDRMYEIVNSGGEVQGVVRDSVCAALANTAPPFVPTLYAGAP